MRSKDGGHQSAASNQLNADFLFEIGVERRAHLVALVEYDSKSVRGVAELLNHPPDQEIDLAHRPIVGSLPR